MWNYDEHFDLFIDALAMEIFVHVPSHYICVARMESFVFVMFIDWRMIIRDDSSSLEGWPFLCWVAPQLNLEMGPTLMYKQFTKY